MEKIVVMPWDLEKLNKGEIVEGNTPQGKIKVVMHEGKIMSFNEPQGLKPYTVVNLYTDEKDVPLNLGKEETARYKALKVGELMTVVRSASVQVLDGNTARTLTLAEQKARNQARIITLKRTPDGQQPEIKKDTQAVRTYLQEYELYK